MLDKIRPQGSETDHIFVGTDRYMYFTLSWNANLQKLQTEDKYVDQSDKGARDTQNDDRCLIDPTRRFMTLQLYEGIITVIPLQQKGRKKNIPSSLGDPLPCRIHNLFVRSSAFLYPRRGESEKPKLALLHEDNHKKMYLTVRTLDYSSGVGGDSGSVDLDEVSSSLEELELGSSHLIPVPAPACKSSVDGTELMSLWNVRWTSRTGGERDQIYWKRQGCTNSQTVGTTHCLRSMGTNRFTAMASGRRVRKIIPPYAGTLR